MFIDICFPKNNEKEFIKIANKLDTESLCFVYSADFDIKSVKNKLEKTKFKFFLGLEIKDSKELNKKVKDVDLVVSEKNSRNFLKSKKINLHYNFETLAKKDSLHYRNSGLNQILCKILKENKKIYSVSFSNILNSNNRSLLLGRYIQNAKLIKKYKNNIIIASFAKNPYELRSFKELLAVAACLKYDLGKIKESIKLFKRILIDK
jgi:RNase P/RNase MRP subunit p30